MIITASARRSRTYLSLFGLWVLCGGASLFGAAEDRFAAARMTQEVVEDAGNGHRRLYRLVNQPGLRYPNVLVAEVWSGQPRAKASVRTWQQAAVADHVIVSVKAGVTLANLTAQVTPLGFTVEPLPPSPIFLVRFPAPTINAIALARAAIRALPGVAYIDEDGIVQIQATPDDPSYGSLWGMAKINAPQAWDMRTDATAIKIAVIDTGIDFNHQDLAANIALNSGETGIDAQGRDRRTNRVDDDGNGFTDDWRGWDFFSYDNNPSDENTSHGTHCAGTVGGVGNNRIGVAGVCWATQIMPIRVFSAIGTTDSSIIQGVEYARSNGAKVLSMSFGGYIYNQAFFDSLRRAQSANILVVCGAGNNAINNNTTPFYPASYNLDNIISVAATTSSDALASFSNFGSVSVDLAAPGVKIYSTTPGNKYGNKDGTSMATPHVAGACALLWADRPSASYLQVRGYILNNVDTVSSLSGKVATGGRLNVFKALTALRNDHPPLPTVTITASDNSATEGSDSGAYTISVTPAQNNNLVVRLRTPTGTAASGSDYSPLPTSVTIPAKTSSYVIPVTPINDTAYESTETVILALEPNAAYVIGTPGSATVSIIDNDKPTVTITASHASVTEGGDTATFTISRGNAINTPLTVRLHAHGTAHPGNYNNFDYTTLPYSITIPANAATAAVTLVVTDDTVAELPETVIWGLTSDPAYVIGSPASATVTINDNEAPVISIIASDATAKEGGSDNGRFTITRWGSRTAALTVNLGRTGTATAGSDYTAIPASVTIPAQANTVNVPVTVIDDNITEPDESVVVTILSGAGYTPVGEPGPIIIDPEDEPQVPLTPSATVYISDNETPRLTIAATDASAAETYWNTNTGTFLITRTGNKAIALTANLVFTGTAINGTDYDALASTLALGVNVSHQTITVRPKDDTIIEPSETVICTIASGTGYVVGTPAAATVTIADNDFTPPVTNLPAPWVSADIGTVGLSGSSHYSIWYHRGGDYDIENLRVSGSGADIWNRADGFHFTHFPRAGDGEFVARVTSLGNTHSWAKAGVMIRADMTPGSVNGLMAITPANGAVFQHRATSGGSTASATVSGRTAPYWVKIKRSGTSVSGWMAADGVAWTQVGTTVVLPLGSTPLVGFAVTSHDNSKAMNAQFSEWLWIPWSGG